MMKKYVAMILAGMMLVGCVGCSNRSMNNIIKNEPSVTGIITEVHDTYIQIYIENEGYPNGALCNVSLDVENKDGSYSPMGVGDEVVVYFNGMIAESAPMQINTVYAITLRTPAKRENSYTQISMEEAVAMMETESEYIILDVRTPEEFAEKHIPNAINVPNETIGVDPVPELPREDQLILVYCRSGNRSKQAAEKLAAIGYSNVYEFGGINDWTGETVGK